MKQNYLWQLKLLAILLLAAGCRKAIQLRQFPQGEIAAMQTLVWEFDTPIAPADSLGKWTDSQLFEFSPPVKGHFKWMNSQLLTFVPETGFPDTNSIQIKAGAALNKLAYVKVPKQEVHLRQFASEGLQTYWVNEIDDYEDYPLRLELSFNEAIDPYELREFIKVQLNGKEVDYLQMNSYSPDKQASFQVRPDTLVTGPLRVAVQVSKGLRANSSGHLLRESYAFVDTVQPKGVLEIRGLFHEFNSGNTALSFRANEVLDAQQIRPYIEIVPPVPFELSCRSNKATLRGDFKPNTRYELICREGMPGLMGGSLQTTFQDSLRTPAPQAFLKFADENGHYLMYNGEESINAKALALDKVDVTFYEIYENNLLHFLRANPSNFNNWNYYSNERDYFYSEHWGYFSLDEYGAEMSNDTIVIPSDKQGEIMDLPIKVPKKLRTNIPGIYAISISSSANGKWFEDYKIFAITDHGIIAKWTPNDLHVFVNRLSTALPAAGAEVKLISKTNQVMRKGYADGIGHVVFKDVGKFDGNKFDARLVTVQSGQDFGFLDLARDRIDNYIFEQDGIEKTQFLGYLYSDRNLYRPGDTVHFSAIIRHWNLKVPKDLPLKAQLMSPNGDKLMEVMLVADAEGAVTWNIPLSYGSKTGKYWVNLQSATSDFWEEYGFQVEDFIPDKIQVNLTGPGMRGQPGDTLLFPLKASYYFGANCDAHSYEGKFRLRTFNYHSNKFPFLNFSNGEDFGDPEWESFNGLLDSAGRDTLRFIVPEEIEQIGLAQGICQLSVLDNTGHPVQARTNFWVATRPYFLGTSTNGGYFSIGDKFSLNYAVMDFGDQLKAGVDIHLKLVKEEWNKSFRMLGSSPQLISEKSNRIIMVDTISSLAQLQNFSYKIDTAGSYLLEIGMVGEAQSRTLHFSAYDSQTATATSFGANREGTIQIEFDKTSYQSGERARVLFKTPFDGRMLVTVERNDILLSQYLDVRNGAAEWTFIVGDKFEPNIFVSATLIRPHRNKKQIPLTVAHGFAMATVDNAAKHIRISTTAPKETKPGKLERITIQTDAGPNAQVTVALVDEGILAIKHFATPNAFSRMYAARECEVNSYDMYAALLPEVKISNLLTGGSDGGDWTSYPHLNPVRSRRYVPFAWWSGILKTDGSGRVTVTIPMQEEFNGSARLMVMAYKGDRFGHSSQHILVRDELVVMPALPRFMNEGDTIKVPVNITNLLEKAGDVQMKVHVEGPLKVLSADSKPLHLQPKESGELNLVLAGTGMGEGKVVLEFSGIKELKQKTMMPVRGKYSLLTQYQSGKISKGDTLRLKLESNYDSKYQYASLVFSAFPEMKLAKHLEGLVGYPHGCTEQTVSKAFPQLYLGDLAEMLAPEAFKDQNHMQFVKAAIEKVEQRQSYSGGFGYWYSSDEHNDWLSVYATHFLFECRRAGYPVRESVLKLALENVQQIAKNTKAEGSYNWDEDQKTSINVQYPKSKLYAIYLLSLANMPAWPTMNYLKDRPNQLSEDSKYFLAGAFALAGQQVAASKIIPPSLNFEPTTRSSYGSFDSKLRAAAIMLNILAEVEPDHPNVDVLLKHIDDNSAQLYNTQERAWTFLALGKLASKAHGTNLKIQVSEAGKPVKGDSLGKKFSSKSLDGKTWMVTTSGEGKLSWSLKQQGYPKTPQKPRPNSNLRIKRSWKDTEGNLVKDNEFEKGQLYVVELELVSQKNERNIAITDLIPSGFEIENLRLMQNQTDWIKGMKHSFGHQNMRDDRAIFYVDLNSKEPLQLYYLLRATNEGQFTIPEISAESMYDPDVHASLPLAQVSISPSVEKVSNTTVQPRFGASNQPAQAEAAQLSPWKQFMKNLQEKQ